MLVKSPSPSSSTIQIFNIVASSCIFLISFDITDGMMLTITNKIVIPKVSPVPLPEIKVTEDSPLSKLLKEAMNAELSASEFYTKLADRFEEGTKLNSTLVYFSDMEKGHYKILEMEKESMERFEEGDVYWPMVHAGP